MQKTLLTSCAAAFLAAGFLPQAARCEDSAKIVQRLQAADSENALDQPGIKPWHLVMTVQLFDEKGNPTDHGTIEERWNGPDSDRRDYSLDSYKSTEIRRDGNFYRTSGTGTPPYYLDLLRDQAVHPMPYPDDVAKSAPELRNLKSGKVALECVMLTVPAKQLKAVPLGLFPTYCFDDGKTDLRASFSLGEEAVLRNRMGIFQGKMVAQDVTVKYGKLTVATSNITKLSTEDIPENKMVPGAEDLEYPARPPYIGPAAIAGILISRLDPIYPESAKEAHVSGTVILRALIGNDGHIHSLRIASTPDAALAMSAIAAVRKWIYKPYLLNGKPTAVDTTITVNFSFN